MNDKICVWWKIPNLLMSSWQLRLAGLVGGNGQLRLWI